MLLPVALRNYRVAGEFLISTAQLGPNLYIGNHPGARGSYEPLVSGHGNAEFERQDATRLAEAAMNRHLTPAEVSNYWTGQAFAYMRGHPVEWLGLMLRKMALTLSAKETMDTESIDAYASYSLILRLLFWFSFGVLLPLAVFGIWVTRHDWRRLSILYAMIAAIVLATAIFYVVARYRFPLVPILILFAAAALVELPRLRFAKMNVWLPGALLAVAIAIPCNVLFRSANDDTMLNIGEELVRSDRAGEAVPVLRTAVGAEPNYAPAHFNLAVALNQSAQKEQALDEFEAALRSDPNYFEARAAMGLTLLETGRPSGAVTQFREAVRLRPESASIHRNLANALAQADRRAEAIDEYRKALALDPNDASAHNGMAVALQQEEKVAEAIEHYQSALALEPNNGGTHSNLALALEALNDRDGAIREFETAVRLQPQHAGIHVNYGDMLARFNRIDEAAAQYEAAVKAAPDSIELLIQLAQLYERANRRADAVAAFERAAAAAKAQNQPEAAAQIEEMLRTLRSTRG